MFVVDYNHHLFDHRKLLILVKNIDPVCDPCVYEDVYASLCTYHGILFPKLLSPNVFLSRSFRVAADAQVDTQSELTFSNQSEEQPVWVRFVRQFHSSNNAWSSFQSHRLVLGIVGLSLCKTADDIPIAIENYLKQKALISENYSSGRLILLIPHNDDPSNLTIEEANEIIAMETKKLLQGLLLVTGEILAHPSEQIFNTDFINLTDISTDSGIGLRKLPPGSLTSTNPPILSTRIVGTLTDLVSHIYYSLEKSVASMDAGKHGKQNLSSASSTTNAEMLDSDGSESNYKVLVAPGESASSRLSDDSSTIDDHKFASKPYVNYAPTDPTGGPATQNDASFNILGELNSWWEEKVTTIHQRLKRKPPTNSTPVCPMDESVLKHRRLSGRWKKHLGDLFLQLGELDKAQTYYDATLQQLRPIMDSLWIAGALEGLCAVAVARKLNRTQFSDLSSRSRRSLRPLAPRNPTTDHTNSRVSDTSSLDLASQKVKPLVQLSSADYRNMALEALELYRRSQLDKYMLEETSYKIARFLISENHKAKACELLDYLFSNTLQDESDDNALKPKRMRILVELYRSMGYKRRASFVAWIALDQNLKTVNEAEFDSLFSGLHMQVFPSLTPAEVESPDSGQSDSVVMLQASPSVVLYRPAFPTSVYPVIIRQSVVWFRGLSHTARLNRLNKCTMAGSSNRSGVAQFNQSKRFQHGTGAIENARFLFNGWAGLQAAVLWRIIEQFKLDVQFDDVLELPWEKALKFTGFIFSLLDAWPNQLHESECIVCMEDLCRLAVMRCPDQPRIALSMPCFTTYASGNADRRYSPRLVRRAKDQVVSTTQRIITIEREGTIQLSRTVQLRQLVDLVEVPVYRLPLVQSLQLLSLVPYLVPCELSKEGLNSAAPVSKWMESQDSENSVNTLTALSEMKASSGPFFYTPLESDSGDAKIASIDWVCEEPVNIELIVDNQLPVDLRISEVRLELKPLFTGLAKPHSSARSSYEFGSITNVANQTNVQLEAVRMVMEVPPDRRARTSSDRSPRQKWNSQTPTTPSTTFPVVLNEACLLETAEDRTRHPHADLDSTNRRRNQSLSCSIPAGRVGIRLVVSFVPMAEMLAVDSDVDDPNSKPLYRVTALTYRLVDFGGMHVCLRSITTTPNPTCPAVNRSQEYSQANHERRLSNASSSATSGFSVLRSSVTSGIESLIHPPTPGSIPPFDFASEHHPALVLATRLFNNLPAILIRPPMPRLYIFPGMVRSAHTVDEAANFLPELTVPSVGNQSQKLSSKEVHSIQPPRFRAALSTQWSKRVAAVVDVSLYPYETRWIPLQLFIRDEGYLPPITPHSTSPSARYLNVFRVDFRPTQNSKDLLEKLNLTAADIVECVGIDAIHEKLPLLIANEELKDTSRSHISDVEDTDLLPIHATECGLIWLGFRSERFWNRLSLMLTRPTGKKDLGEGLNLRNSKKISVEFEIEYALNAPTGSAAKSVSFSNPFWARRVRLGVQLNLLSSKHAPLLLYHPQILFRDEPFGDDDEEDEDSDVDVDDLDGTLSDVNSKAFFYCTFRARLPQSLVPRPIRFIGPQYRIELELRTRWHDRVHPSTKDPYRLSTPWTVLSENQKQRMGSISPSRSPPLPQHTHFFRSESIMSSSSVATDSFNTTEQYDEQSKDETRLYQCVALPLSCLSDVALTAGPVQLADPEHLRADEIGLPVPKNTAWLLHAIESNIEIMWKSRLFGRAPQPETRGLLAPDWSSRINEVLPDPRFYRFGRFILSAHVAEQTLPERQTSVTELPASPRTPVMGPVASPKNWYGNSFSTPGLIAGLLWCHNIRLEVSLSEFPSVKQSAISTLSNIKKSPQGRLCVRCRDEGPRNRRRKSIFARRVSQPLPCLSNGTAITNSSLSKLAQKKNINDDSDSECHVAGLLRRASVPELRNPQSLRGVSSDVLQSTPRMCTLPLEPISIMVKGWVHYHPLQRVKIHDPVKTDPTNLQDNSPPCVDIHRIWTGPVVYEILPKNNSDIISKESQTVELKGPLLQGKEFEFIGKAGGEMGLSLGCQLKEMALEPHTSSVVFFRPGRFWICGLMGIVPQSLQLPSVNSDDLAVFTLPSVSNVETIRFSPTGIIVHVLDSSRVLEESS